jgi:NAD(P)-dependent dehydrogenase (short-subunit alcohol dehydrogenase family)
LIQLLAGPRQVGKTTLLLALLKEFGEPVPARPQRWCRLWRRSVELNLNSVCLVSKEIAPAMKAGSSICNTASIAGIVAAPELAAYAAAKAGVISYTRSFAIQLGPKGIRVNCVAPGLIYTRLWEQLGAALSGGIDHARAASRPLSER